MNRVWIHSYGCTSAAGPATSDFWQSLTAGTDHSEVLNAENWPAQPQSPVRACLWKVEGLPPTTARAALLVQMKRALREALDGLDASARQRILVSEKLGVILASTKSFVDDYVWSPEWRAEENSQENSKDAFAPLLSDFLSQSGLAAARSLTVSNACASALSALFLAKQWLRTGEFEDVLVISVDRIGPFVANGFDRLRALTTDRVRPFSADRNGLQLGEAAAAIILSSQAGPVELEGVGIDAEGFAVTRPSQAGDSLKRACLKLKDLRSRPPELIIAHGTATRINDSIEDQVFREVFAETGSSPAITGTKWCIGHTLGASGAMDVIAACEVIKRQQWFRIGNTPEVDPEFKGRYLTSLSDLGPKALRRVMVTSLGFGGIHAATILGVSS